MTPKWRTILLRDPCVYCLCTSKSIDHIHPRAHGGRDNIENMAPVCKGCNLMKADGSMLWMLWRRNESRLGRKRRRVIGFRLTSKGRMPIKTALEYQGRLRNPGECDALIAEER